MATHDDGEQLTFILPSGERQDFLIPSGMSDAEARVYVLARRPDLFQRKAPSFLDAANQAKQQSISQGKALMDAGGYPELANAKPTGRVGHVAAPEPDVEGTLGALPAVGGTVGGAL